jgi:drug/metabolite transporter (DMT)-like permease
MPTIIAAVIVVALFWGGWPLVARGAGDVGLPGALLMSVTSLATVGVAAFAAGTPFPAAPAAALLAAAGVMMGLGLIAFNAASTSPLVEASTIIPILDASMLLVAMIGGIWFFGEELSARKIAGIALLITGILVLKPQG